MVQSGGTHPPPTALPLFSAEGLRRGIARALIASLTIPGPLATAPVAAAPRPVPYPLAPATWAGAENDSCRDALGAGDLPAVSVAESELWPPNHTLANIGLSVDPGEACRGRAAIGVAVYSDEPDDATGDGSTIHDAQLDPPDLYLRAERQGHEDGRVYLVVATASYQDRTGRGCAAVVVPHSRTKADRASVEAQAQAAVEVCEDGGLPSGYHRLVEGPLVTPNQPPVVDAGPNQGIDLGETAHLDGTVTDDGLPGGTLEITWSLGEGPGAVDFSSPNAEDTEASFSEAGTYRLVLTADDGELSAWDDVEVLVQAQNAAPTVDAGPDLALTLPTATVRITGSVTDDGRVLSVPIITWTQEGGPPGVSFVPVDAAVTDATFPGAGVFLLRLSANDGQFIAFDELEVTVNPEPPPTVDIEDVAVVEGQEGLSGASLEVRLSKPWVRPVSVDYVTVDGTATHPCDYRRRYGTLEVPAGNTVGTVLVPVVGDQVPEGDEEAEVLLGNPQEATLGRDRAALFVTDDDGPNQAPTAHAPRGPANGSTGVPPTPTLTWSSSDPDAVDTVTHDVYLGTAFSTNGQQWLPVCPSGEVPPPRWGAVSGYDEASDRLIVYGGETPDGPADTDLLVLLNASASGGAPEWQRIPTSGGPGALVHATGGYDPVANRLVVFGGCLGSCDVTTDETWVLTGANGLEGPPVWQRLEVTGPVARFGHAAAYDLAANRLLVFGGAAGEDGDTLGDLWGLDGANGLGLPVWTLVDTGPNGPVARLHASLAHDPATGALVLFGGRDDEGNALGDLWMSPGAEPGAEWTPLPPAGAGPAGRFGHGAAFDPASGRLLVYGGSTAGLEDGVNYVFDDAWMLIGARNVSPAAEWNRVAGGGIAPVGRFSAAVTWAPGASRLIVAGGGNNKLALPPADLWLLDDAFGELPLVSADQLEPSYVATEAETGEVFYWRVVTRDDHGAWRGSPAWSFTTNNAPTVDAGPDLVIDLPPGRAELDGAVGDDGLPVGSSLTVSWSQVSGPGTATFADATSPTTTATFDATGLYTLRLTVQDTQLEASDEIVVDVRPANQAPVVSAGPDIGGLLPGATVTLTGVVSDDGLPTDTLTLGWSQVSGPVPVSFASPSAAVTDATFPAVGTYVLRLTASDGELEAMDEVTVDVPPVNLAPLVSAGPDRGLRPPSTSVDLEGAVSDDGLPAGVLILQWSKTSGPGTVTFTDPESAVTTATFDTPGTYVLRLEASDGVLAASDEVTVFFESAGVLPDLVVPVVDATTLQVDPRSLELSGETVVQIRNAGPGTAAGPFTVTVFEDQDEDGAFTPGTDAVLGQEVRAGLSAGAAENLPIAAVGSVRFAGNLVYAFVDSGFEVPEADETNNYGSSSPGCADPRSPDEWNVDVEWAWTSTEVDPVSTYVVSGPVVVDVDADTVPDVLFVAYGTKIGSLGYNTLGRLRALSGRDGSEIWSVIDAGLGLNGGTKLAAGDIDGDGHPEILASDKWNVSQSLVAFEHDGSFKWRTDLIENAGFGGASIADLDGDGTPEIVVGRQALSHDGTVLWTGPSTLGPSPGGHSTVVDLDLDGLPEVVYGNAAYRAQGPDAGQFLWHNTETVGEVQLRNGFTAAGNLDADPEPEIVLTTLGWVFALEHDGTVKWGPTFLEPVRIRTWGAGPPTLADFDGDGELEIAVGGTGHVVVFETDGSLKWRAPNKDSIPQTGLLAFDFDGDGAAEVVHGAEQDLAIYRGSDGVILFRDLHGSRTAGDVPTVADVDGDGEVEILAVTDAGMAQIEPGVRVYGEKNGLWPVGRQIFNQFDYSVTNVNDDGTIPRRAERDLGLGHRWAHAGSVDNGPLVPTCAFPQPDLTASAFRLASTPTEWELTARIGNGGARVVGSGVAVSFYDGDPRLGGRRLGGIVTTSYLHPGQYEDVTLVLPRARTTRSSVFVSADDSGDLKGQIVEASEANNLLDSGEALTSAEDLPDLTVVDVDVSGVPVDGQSLSVSGEATARVRNQNAVVVTQPFEVAFFEDRDGDGELGPADVVLGQAPLGGLGALETVELGAGLSGTLLFRGSPVRAFVDSTLLVAEADETNNTAGSEETCQVHPSGEDWTLREEWVWTGPPYGDVLSVPAVGDVNGDGVPDVVFPARTSGNTTTDGQIRIVSGADGLELVSVVDRAWDVATDNSVALGDIDGDGQAEIVAVAEDHRTLLAFEADGSVIWRSPLLEPYTFAAAPFLADLDGDPEGRAEILLGRQVLNGHDGSVRWTGTGPYFGRMPVTGHRSIAADLDLDGAPEVLVGPSAYMADGTLLWAAAGLNDGLAAVGNFDDDPHPEIVISNGSLWLLEHDGTVSWGPVNPGGTGFTGPVTIADFDGDGLAEIGVGKRSSYSVVEGYGQIRWSIDTLQSDIRWNTGGAASAFDLDGDGAAELVFADTAGIHIVRGRDGVLLGELPTGTCNSSHAHPLVVDVDADGKAEILVGASALCAANDVAGLRAYGEAADGWIRARPLWNQAEYTLAAVEDDLTMPWPAVPGWLDDNTWRSNKATVGSAFAAADLTASYVRRTEEGTDLRFTVRIGNAGLTPVGPGVPVSLHNGDPRLGYPHLATTVTTGSLGPGEYEDVDFTLWSQLAAEAPLVFVADDQGDRTGVVSECDEENNFHDSGFQLNQRPSVEAGADQTTAMPDATVLLEGTAEDDGLPLGESLSVTWFYASGPVPRELIGEIFGDRHSLTTTVTLPTHGAYSIGLDVTDSKLGNRDFLTITVHPENLAPVVSAGPDQTVILPATVAALDGAVSDDGLPVGSVLTSSWSVVSAPGPVVFADPASPVTTATLSEPGTYVLRLTASDEALETSDDVTVVLETPNEPPLVNAGLDQRVLTLATALAGTVDDDGKPAAGTLISTWSLVSGPGPATFADDTLPETTVTFDIPGIYVLRLTANDGELEASDDVVVNADPANQPPAVDAGPDQPVTSPRTALLGTVVDDGLPVGSTLTFLWTQSSGPAPATLLTPTAVQTEALFDTEGTYVFELTASDTEFEASDTVTVEVAFVNTAPVVEAGPDAAVVLPVNAVDLPGTVADDGLPLGNPLEAAWRIVTGPAAVVFDDPSAPQTTARFTDPGTYVLRLRVSDGELVGQDEVTVVVQPTAAGGPVPVAVLSFPAPGTRLTAPADVTGTAESASLASWQLEHQLEGEGTWTRFASGTAEVTNDVLGRFDPSLLVNGVHEVRLTVTDTDGRAARASTRVVVRDQMKVGHFTVSFVDLEVPVAGLPMRVTRTYDSRDKGKGDFGHGWRLDLANVRVNQAATLGLAWYGSVSPGAFASYCLQPTTPPLVTLTFPDGRVQEFEMRVDPQCQAFAPMSTVQASFVPVGPTLGRLDLVGSTTVQVVGSWPGPIQLFNAGYSLLNPEAYRYTAPDGQEFVVDREAGLQSLTDRAGNVLTLTPAGISSAHPEVPGSELGIVFERDPEGRISRIVDPDGRALTYEYDASGDLVSATDREENTTTFTYLWEPAHHLETIDDPLGRTPIRNEYDESGRLTAHVDAFGFRIEYTHDIVGRQEIVRDRNGDQRVLEYDERGNVLRETDPQGKVVDRTFDARNNRLTETEPYDPASPPDPIPTTTYAYDGQDNLLSVEDPLGNATTYTYNAFRQVLTTTDARNNPTTSTYDAKGNLLSTKDALDNVTEYTYDGRGNVLTQTVTVDGTPQVTTYEYDPAGRLERETDATGHETTYTYDASGNRLSQTTTRTTPQGTDTLVTSYEYDANGRLTRTTDPDGTETTTVYDALGRQIESYDKRDRKTTYAYDEMGRLVRTTYPDSTFEEHGYDKEGRRTSFRDRGDRTTEYLYDKLGRLVKTTHPDTSFTENVYDDAGRLVEIRDARGNPTFYEYDSAGRRTKVRNALNQQTVFTYDANGNQEAVTDTRGNTVTYEYDALNRRTRTIFPPAKVGEPVTFTQTGYDELGRRVSETDQAGKTTTFEYDALGRLTKVIDALTQETTYGYDEVGNRISQTDARNHTTGFAYDKLGRQTARVLPDGSREEMTYDAAGNLETRTDFMNRVTTYAYDDNNRLLSRTYPNPDENVSFTYTPTGRRLTATYNGETTAYEYDTRDRLTKVTHPDGRELQYEHDAQGNRLKLTAILTGLSLVSSYTFDPLNRLEDVTDPAERVYTHGYDENGNRASLVHPNGVETAYTYDTLNRLTNLATTHPGLLRTIQTYAFTLGPAGNRTRIVEAAGLPQERTLDYGYDDLYRLTGETVTESLGIVYTKTFGYDPVGNRLSQTTTIGPAGSPGPVLQDGTLSYGYDTRDRLLTEQLDALPATGYGWDDNGNLTTKDAEATYTWDHENRLVRVSKTDGTVVEHVYDPDGNRVQTSVTPPAAPATTTDFLVDTSGALSHVVAETADTGALKTYYVRGDDLLAVMRPLVTVPAAPEDWQTRYSHADGLGSIRRLTDEGANITDGYTYTAFGELLAHTGTDPQPYAFTGEPLDPNSGWQYHRARWMDPRVGRFAGVDPWEGMEHDPVSLHRYLYAEMNPVGSSDPSGRYTLTQLTIAGGIIGALAGASAYTLTRDSAEEFTWTGFGKWTLGGAILGAAIGAGVYYGPVISVRWAGAAPGVLKTWQQAEKFLGRTLGMTKNTIDLLINGRIRIPDFLDHARRFVGESKFVQELYLTGRVGQQLRDYADYCRLNGYRMYVFVRHDTKIGAKVVQLVEQTGGSIVRMFVQD